MPVVYIEPKGTGESPGAKFFWPCRPFNSSCLRLALFLWLFRAFIPPQKASSPEVRLGSSEYRQAHDHCYLDGAGGAQIVEIEGRIRCVLLGWRTRGSLGMRFPEVSGFVSAVIGFGGGDKKTWRRW